MVYSLDFKLSVVRSKNINNNNQDIMDTFNISKQSIYNWTKNKNAISKMFSRNSLKWHALALPLMIL